MSLIEKFLNGQENNKNGWQGRLCWDISFICSYNKIKVDKKYSYSFLTKLSKDSPIDPVEPNITILFISK